MRSREVVRCVRGSCWDRLNSGRPTKAYLAKETYQPVDAQSSNAGMVQSVNRRGAAAAGLSDVRNTIMGFCNSAGRGHTRPMRRIDHVLLGFARELPLWPMSERTVQVRLRRVSGRR